MKDVIDQKSHENGQAAVDGEGDCFAQAEEESCANSSAPGAVKVRRQGRQQERAVEAAYSQPQDQSRQI